MVDRDSRRHTELAGQFVAFHRRVLRAELAGFPNIGNPGISQAHEGRQTGVVRTAELRRHRAHRRVAAALAAVVRPPRQWIAGLHGDRRVVARLAVDRPNHRQFVGDRRLPRQMFGKLNPRNLGRDHVVGAANFLGSVRLGIPHVDVAGTAGEPEKDYRLLVAAPPSGCLLRRQDSWQREPAHASQAQFEKPAARTNSHEWRGQGPKRRVTKRRRQRHATHLRQRWAGRVSGGKGTRQEEHQAARTFGGSRSPDAWPREAHGSVSDEHGSRIRAGEESGFCGNSALRARTKSVANIVNA